ncbi:MAG: hypothetical protein WCA32_03250 [Chromatiaceae bacterium]
MPRLSPISHAQLVAGWIAANPPDTTDAWEPHTVSLRIVNWVTLFVRPEWRWELVQAWPLGIGKRSLA